MAKEHAMIESGRRQSLGKRIWKTAGCISSLLPGIAFVLLFCYGPMYGLVVAFKDYKISKRAFWAVRGRIRGIITSR